MKQEDFIWEFLPSGLKGIFEIKDVRKTSTEFHVYLDEIRQKGDDDRWNKSLVGKGYTEYSTIQDHLTRGLATYLHLRKCKWLDKETGETMPQILLRSKRALMLSSDKWKPSQKQRIEILFRNYPILEQAYAVMRELRDIFWSENWSHPGRCSACSLV